MKHPLTILEQYWNFTSFRPKQEAIINAIIDGEDTFVLLPTGGGKSLCFQIPALAKEGICIVISPLIALMRDQVIQLNNKGIKAIAITSGISYNELDTLLDNCIYGNYKFLYLSPERLQQELVQERIKQMPVNLIAVDEAHCISQWGNDFRPSYKNITLLRQIQPTVNVVALTASAKPNVIDDIITELDFIKPKIFKQSFFRENIAYMVYHETDKYYKLERILKKHTAPSIVYVRNRKSTYDVCDLLKTKNISATFYHGGLSHAEKEANMSSWIQNQTQTMVATNAFGMGIDKPDVKTVIHLNLPESIESYFQEAGRAGRNGKKAFAVILKNENDEVLVKNQFLRVLPTVSFVKQVYRKLCNYFQISYNEGEQQTFDFDFSDFCKTYDYNAILCYNALMHLDRNSVISLSKQFKNNITIQFIITNKALIQYLELHTEIGIVVKSILRLYSGIFDYSTTIDVQKITNKASVSQQELIHTLKLLERDKVITLNIAKTDAQVTFIEPREDDKTINRIAAIIEQQNQLKQHQVESILNYVENNTICKSKQLLNYFGETNAKSCGICNSCLYSTENTKLEDTNAIKSAVIKCLENGDSSSRELLLNLKCTESKLKQVLKLLLEHHIITITPNNTYKLSHL